MGASLALAGSSTTPWGVERRVAGCWFEVETRYWVVRLHAACRHLRVAGGCVAGPPRHRLHVVQVVGVWGCFLRTT